MKTIACVAILALFMMTIVTPSSASALVSAPAASGTYRVVLEDGLAGVVTGPHAGDPSVTRGVNPGVVGGVGFDERAVGAVDHDCVGAALVDDVGTHN